MALGARRSLPIRPYLHARITRITSVEQLPQTSVLLSIICTIDLYSIEQDYDLCAIVINSWASDCKHNCELMKERQLFEHIASLGEATIPADANTGQAPHCAHKEACSPFILLWRRSCTPQGGMLLVTSLGEATIPADANTGQACRRVVAVGSSPAYHRLSHANT